MVHLGARGAGISTRGLVFRCIRIRGVERPFGGVPLEAAVGLWEPVGAFERGLEGGGNVDYQGLVMCLKRTKSPIPCRKKCYRFDAEFEDISALCVNNLGPQPKATFLSSAHG